MPIDIELIEDGESGLSVRQKLNTLIEGAVSGSLGTPLPPGVGDTTPPAVPTGLTVTSSALPRSTMLIEWNLNTETDFSFYDLQVKKEFGHWVSYQTSADAHVLDTTANTNYSVRIRAVDRSGNASEFCDIVAHLTSRDEVPPATPIGVSATGGLSVIWLLWTPNSEDDLSHYEIFESSTTTTPTADASGVYVAQGHSFSRAGFGDGVTRHFWVRAVDTSGNKSPWSTRVEATTAIPVDTDAPATPTGLAVTSTVETLANGTQRVKLNASCAVNSETDLAGYIFEIKEGAGNYVGFSTNTNSYEWALVKPGVAYTVRVSTFDKSGNKSAPSAGVAHTAGADTNAPATPAGVTADGGFGFIALRWTKNSEADLSYYEIYQHTASTPAPTAGTAATFTSASNALNITGLAPNTTRHYWVRAVDTSGNKSAWSSRVQATTVYVTIPNITPSTIGTPGLPSLGASTALASDGSVVVTLTADWTAASNAVAYEIGITEGGGGEIIIGVASLYHAWAARAGVLYSVRVRGINEIGGKGAWTTAATLTPGGDTTAPGVPTGLTATPGFNTIWLSWAQVAAADLSHYEIYIHTAATPAPVAGTAATHIVRGTSFVHQGLANGAQRWYWVRAVDLSGNKSAWTASVNATTTTITIPDITDQTLGAAGVPTLTSTLVTDAHGSISVQIEAVWTAATNAVSYEVGIKEGAANEVFFPVGDLRFRFAGRPGILYTVRVRPISKLGAKGSWTTTATVTPAGDTTPPATPTSLSAIAGLDTVWLSWVNPADTDFSHVEIFENTVNNSGTATKIGEARGTSASRTVSLEATRYYWLKAVDTSGNKSGFSSVTSATTGSIPEEIQLTVEGILFQPAQSGGNRLTWTAGSISYGPNGAAPTTKTISAGYVDWTSGTVYVYYVPGNTALSTTTSLTTVYSSSGLIVGVYKGGTNYQLVEGRAYQDGGLILAQTIGANQLVTNAVVITGSAQIANAIIGTAHVNSISAAKIEADTALAGSITVSGRALRTVIDDAYHDDMSGQAWAKFGGAGAISFSSGSGYPTGNAGMVVNGPAAVEPSELVPFDRTKLYRITCRLWVPDATTDGDFYAGLRCYDSASTWLDNIHCVAAAVSQNGAVFRNGGVSAGWVDVVAYARGASGTGTNASGVSRAGQTATGANNTVASPATLYAGTRFVRPYVICNWTAGTGTVHVDMFRIEVVNEDAGAIINAGSTQIDPGKILISGGSSLADWRKAGDLTKIDGGALSANTVDANRLTIGNRNIKLSGIQFEHNSPAANQVSWTSGSVSYVNDAGAVVSVNIAAGNATWTSDTLWLYWAKDATSISATTTAATAMTSSTVVLAAYKGGTDLVTDYGRTVIDGAFIKTGTLDANHIKAGSITANELAIGDFTNLVPDAQIIGSTSWSKNSFWSGPEANGQFDSPGVFRYAYQVGATGYGGYLESKTFPVVAGETYRLSFQLKELVAPNDAEHRVLYRFMWFDSTETYVSDSDLTVSPTDTALNTYSTTKVVTPTNARYARMRFYVFRTGQTGDILIGSPVVQRMNAGSLIVNGGVTADHVGANQIITYSANIADAIITSAKILSLDAGKLQAGTALAGSITVSGTALSTIGSNAANGQTAFSKFSGSGGTLPAGNVEFNFAGSLSKGGNASNTDAVGGQMASTVATAVVNFNANNDRIATTPANPVVATDGTAVDHTISTDGSANISFEWNFAGSGDAYDIDGFIVYVRQSTSSSAYAFGSAVDEEQVYYVTPEKRAFIVHGVPADRYYTFGVQAYRIVDTDIDANGAKKSGIVKSSQTEENPYRPSATVAFSGDISGTLNGSAVATVVANAALGAQDPVDRINAGSTQIDPGKIVINGATSLADWRKAGDLTKIDGGALSANTVDANKMTIGQRGIKLAGIQFEHNSPSANKVSWTSGAISYINDAGASTSVNIAAGNADWSSGTLYLYWVKDATSISSTTTLATAQANNAVILAAYRGGTDLVADYGRTVIDGAFVKTGTLEAQHIKAGSITARELAIGDFTNLVPDAQIIGSTSWQMGSFWSGPEANSQFNSPGVFRYAYQAGATGYGLPANSGLFPVISGETYRLSFQAKGSSAPNDAQHRILMRFYWFDSNKAAITYTDSLHYITDTALNTYSVTKTVTPENARFAYIQWYVFRTGQTGDVLVGSPVVQRMNAGSLIVNGGIIAAHVGTNEIIANAANIKDAIITSAKILSLDAGKIQAGTALAGSITVSGTALSVVESRAADPAARINAASTQIDPGKILISGATSLSNWIKAGDLTKIDGGQISANTILANSAIFGLRGLTIDSLQFEHNSPSANSVSWTAGSITYTNDAGSTVTQAISAGNAAWTTGTLYIYYVQGASTLSTTTTAATANASNAVILTTYKGGTNLVSNYGRTIIDGSNIKTGTITATQADITSFRTNILTANVISATMLQSNIVAARHMVLSSNDNLVPNGDFSDGSNALDYWTTPAGAGTLSYSTTYTKSGARSLNLAKTVLANNVNSTMGSAFSIPVTPGEVLFGETEVMTDGTATTVGFYFRVLFYQKNNATLASPTNADIANNQPVGTSWTLYSKQITVPSNAAWARVQIYNGPGQTTTANFFIDRLVLRRANGASLTVDGSIKGQHLDVVSARAAILVAGSIQAEHLAISQRGINVSGLSFDTNNPATNQVSWTAGTIAYINDAGAPATASVTSSYASWTTGTIYIYWVKGATTLSSTTTLATAMGTNNVIVASYKGGSDLTVEYGGTTISGNKITTGVIQSANGKMRIDLDNGYIEIFS